MKKYEASAVAMVANGLEDALARADAIDAGLPEGMELVELTKVEVINGRIWFACQVEVISEFGILAHVDEDGEVILRGSRTAAYATPAE